MSTRCQKEATMPERQTRALQVLHDNVQRLRDSDEWKAALAIRAKFHRYSFNNVLLIHFQCPTATMVAGYQKWQELGRQVRKGEKSIAILAPLVGKRDNDAGEKVPVIFGFRTASVFDVSQTEGEDIPTLPTPPLLHGDDDACERVYAELTVYALTLGSPIAVVDDVGHPDALGCYNMQDKTISVRSDLQPKQRLKTSIHEVAHALLHNRHETGVLKTPHELRELEAESTAYLVADALGLDVSAYSFSYMAHYAHDPEVLMKSGDAAAKAADTILSAIAPKLNTDSGFAN